MLVTTPHAPQAPANRTEAGRWPDFVGIGAIKCGTTWLHHCLSEHPQVLVPTTKELQFFDERFALGAEWYKEFFVCGAKRVCGEISPQYMHDERVLRRIQESLPNTRFIVCLRNPIDRAYSHFMMDMRDVKLSPRDKVDRFDQAVHEKANKYLQYGFFYRQLSPYYEAFGAERIHVVLFDDIESTPTEVLRNVFAFLRVDESFTPSSMRSKINAAKKYRSIVLFKTLQTAVRLVEKAGGKELILRAKMGGLRDRVLRLLEVRESYPPMHGSARSALATLYADDVRDLARLVRRDLTHWLRQ